MLSIAIANLEVPVEVILKLAVGAKGDRLVLDLFLFFPRQEEPLICDLSCMVD